MSDYIGIAVLLLVVWFIGWPESVGEAGGKLVTAFNAETDCAAGSPAERREK